MPNRSEFQTRHGTGKKQDRPNTGAMQLVKAAKNSEAWDRNLRTPEIKRRQHWRDLGFTRESHAARVIREAVAQGNVISKTIIPDLEQDPATVKLLTEIFASESL